MQITRSIRHRVIAFVHDVIIAMIATLLAFAARLGFDYRPDFVDAAYVVGAFVLAAATMFPLVGLYQASWRYTSMRELSAIIKGATIAVLGGVLLTFLINRGAMLPRSVPMIIWCFMIVGLGVGRVAVRVAREGDLPLMNLFYRSARSTAQPVILIGFTDDSELFIRSTETQRQNAPFRAIGIIDDNPRYWNRRMRGVPVLGSLELLGDRFEAMKEKPRRLIVMSDVMKRDHFRPSLRQVLDLGEKFALPVTRFAGSGSLVTPMEGLDSKLQDVSLDNMLNRSMISLDMSGMRQIISGKVIFVTGAGGSIGSEIVRQVAALSPAKLIMVDNSEHALFSIDNEIRAVLPELHVEARLCDICNDTGIDALIGASKPDVVFHAAALKHVSMVENNPVEGIRTNVFGTINVARAAMAHAVGIFVQISTDKAVEPTSVMGATKRLGERLCQSFDVASETTRFVIVRFGNVLGSTGSVIPLFRRQIRRGGPVTVTDRDVTRYFMTIEEAVQLVLKAAGQAAANGYGRGRILVLKMGEPVRILDLAEKMIRMAGFEPGSDIAIEFIGLRTGEKVHEKLLSDAESAEQTATDNVVAITAKSAPRTGLDQRLTTLRRAVDQRAADKALAALAATLPDYQPATTLPKPSRKRQTSANGATRSARPAPAVSSDSSDIPPVVEASNSTPNPS